MNEIVVNFPFGLHWDLLLKSLFLFIVLDYLFGMFKALKNRELSSRFGWEGIMRKFSILIVIVIADTIDQLLIYESNLSITSEPFSLRTIVILAYITNELISILENLRDSGVYIPNILIKAINYLDDKTINSKKNE